MGKGRWPRNNADKFSVDQDAIIVYGRSPDSTVNRMPRTTADNARFKNPDNDTNGPWWDGDPTARHNRGRRQHPSVYGIQHPITGEMKYPGSGANWYFAQDWMLNELSHWADYELVNPDSEELSIRAELEGEGVEIRDDIPCLKVKDWGELTVSRTIQRLDELQWPRIILRGADGSAGGFGLKMYIPERGTPARTLWRNSDVGHNRSAKNEIKSLLPGVVPFSTPKPERLLERIIHIGSNPGDIVLDVFAGSGTTAAVAQKMGRRWVTCELLESTFKTFTRPRLEKVINDQDPGGITRTKGDRVDATEDGLPDGVSPEDAAKFTSVLNKLIADDPQAKKDARVKALKAASKTRRTKEVVNWRGGGGFQVAHLSPSCFDYDPELDRVVLTTAATGQTLIESVAANLGFTLLHPDDDYVFEGRRGNSLLKVVEGVATIEEVDRLVEQIDPGEKIVLAATVVLDGVRQHLRRACKGSRVVAIPDDIFRYSEGGDQ